ncbi:integrase [Bacterioplanes sanyensis]|uniref:tyrosine-type recombinase/integrase n=1 Tax=Bacterioplanes sanyensis TaxID=1249553 RepID=UPI001674E990|nr:integrase arm-type DNA-binding domain-containing protein [Bacterioplanes sanyensis]GGY39227.1 integrase [Bacterioplanes sanyensis]
MPLTHAAAKNAAAKAKDYKLFDEKGLFLLVKKSGAKYWRLKYRINGKEKLLAIGVYPEVTLKQAREKAFAARQLIQQGDDPVAEKQAQRQAAATAALHTFEPLARRWHELNTPRWTPRYALKVMQMLERRIFPFLGQQDVSSISGADVLAVLRRMEDDGVRETTRKVKTYLEHIFTYALAEGIVKDNPVPGITHALKALPPAQHQRSLPFEDMPAFLAAIEADSAHPIVKLGLKLVILTMTRTGEVRFGRWDEIDWDKRLWCIPAARMKMRSDHIIPLSDAAIQVLRELQKHTGKSHYLVRSPNNVTKPLSENAFLLLIKRIGYQSKTTTHGLRATASTVLNEAGFRPDVIEKQLAHEERNQVRKAYNRALYLEERRQMLQWWADQLFQGECNLETLR